MGHWSDTSLFHIIAHRGASAYAPDNSLEAFELAGRHGATDIEVDVQCTTDGQLVVQHDSIVGQPPKFISELSYDEYSSRHGSGLQLDQAIQVAKQNGLGVYLDVKQVLPQALPNLIATIRNHGYQQQTVVASPRTDILKEVKQQAPDLLTSFLFYGPNLEANSLVKGVGCDFLHPCFDIFADPLKRFTAELVDRLNRTGAGIIAWNLTSEMEAKAVVVMDIRGACADDPQIIKKALEAKSAGR